MRKIGFIIFLVLAVGIWGYYFKSSNSDSNRRAAANYIIDKSGEGMSKLADSILSNVGVTRLDLSNNRLTSLPSEIGKLTNLKELILSNNLLEGALPGEIRKMPLELLDASKNRMTGIPAEIGQLNLLKVLDYSNNQLDTMPNEIANLTGLESLNLANNLYRAVPDSILELTNLKTLDLSGNPLSSTEVNRAKAALPNTNVIF